MGGSGGWGGWASLKTSEEMGLPALCYGSSAATLCHTLSNTFLGARCGAKTLTGGGKSPGQAEQRHFSGIL